MKQLKRNLQAGHSVTRAMYDAGYSSSSRLYERTASHLGMSPDKYRRGIDRSDYSLLLHGFAARPDARCRYRQRYLRNSIR